MPKILHEAPQIKVCVLAELPPSLSAAKHDSAMLLALQKAELRPVVSVTKFETNFTNCRENVTIKDELAASLPLASIMS